MHLALTTKEGRVAWWRRRRLEDVSERFGEGERRVREKETMGGGEGE